jgi:hypothetical protein
MTAPFLCSESLQVLLKESIAQAEPRAVCTCTIWWLRDVVGN